MIVCATRGGEASRAVQQQAIAYALKEDESLMFLFVADETQYGAIGGGLRSAFKAELLWMAETLMTLLQKRGRSAGIGTNYRILEGNVKEQIVAYLREQRPELLFVGAPRGTTSDIIGDDEIEQFALEIEKETGVKVIVARPDVE